MIRTQISMTGAQQDAVRRVAAARGVSQAAVFRDALDTVLDHQLRGSRVDRARLATGAYRSGDSNLAIDHDDALDESFSV